MASTFRELHDDYLATINLYTEKLPATEVIFMRYFTRAMQIFQRQTELLTVTIPLTLTTPNPLQTPPPPPGIPPSFRLPQDFLRPIEVYDSNGIILVPSDYRQQTRNMEVSIGNGHLETPVDYSFPLGRRTNYPRVGNFARTYSIDNRSIVLHPTANDTMIIVKYIMDLHPISSTSTQWTNWYPLETNFYPLFNTTTVRDELVPYERAFVSYAASEFIKATGNPNYLVFMKDFEAEVKMANENKYTNFREGVSGFRIAPFS